MTQFSGEWIIVFLTIMMAALFFMTRQAWRRYQRQQAASVPPALPHLVKFGEKIRVTLDNGEVKSRSTYEEVLKNSLSSDVDAWDALYPGTSQPRQIYNVMSYIVYERVKEGQVYRYISQPTGLDPVTLRMHIERRKGVDLYIDRNDPHRYWFDLSF